MLRQLGLIAILLLNFSLVGSMDTFIIDTDGAPWELNKNLDERILALILDAETCSHCMSIGIFEDKYPSFIGKIGFYWAVVRDVLLLPNDPALFVKSCKELLVGKSKKYLEENFSKRVVALGVAVNIWSTYLIRGDKTVLSDKKGVAFLLSSSSELESEQILDLSRAHPAEIAQLVMQKFKKKLNPDPNYRTEESALLEDIFLSKYDSSEEYVAKKVMGIFDAYNQAQSRLWSVWARRMLTSPWRYVKGVVGGVFYED